LNILFNDDIAWPANHDQMFNIITTNENQSSFRIDNGSIHDSQPYLTGSAASTNTVSGKTPKYGKQNDKCKHNGERNQNEHDTGRHILTYYSRHPFAHHFLHIQNVFSIIEWLGSIEQANHGVNWCFLCTKTGFFNEMAANCRNCLLLSLF